MARWPNKVEAGMKAVVNDDLVLVFQILVESHSFSLLEVPVSLDTSLEVPCRLEG